MNRNLILLIAAALLLTVGWLMSRDGASDGGDDRNQPLLPAVANDVNQVSGFSLTQGGGELIVDIDRVEDRWVVSSSSNYPADVGKVRQFLLAIKDAEKREERTSRPDRYADIGVEDPASADAKGVLLQLDGVDEPNRLIIGNFAAGGGEYTYVRVVGEERSWLANGNLVPERNLSNWLQRDIMDIPSNRIARVEITSPEGDVLAIDKVDEVAPNYTVENVPNGRELSSESAGNILASALGSLQLEEVLAEDQAQPVAEQTFTNRYLTRDGLIITATVWKADEKHYAQFVAAIDPDFIEAWSLAEQARKLAEMKTQMAAADAAAAEGGEGESAAAPEFAEPDLAAITSEHRSKLQAQASEINQVASGWVFVIPSWKYANMAKRMDDLLAAKE